MIVKTIEIAYTEEGEIKMTLTLPPSQKPEIGVLTAEYRKAKDKSAEQLYTADIKPYKPKRSLNANAYFHLLVGKIAQVMRKGADEVKIAMVLDYGTVARDEHGEKVGIKLPVSVNVKNIYPYAKWFDERTENGKKFNCYIIYKQTRDLDRAEMARLIEGVINEANELGIETITPQEKERMLKMIKE
jgi:hypothetical protein